MKIMFKEQSGLFVHFNPRAEMHGDEPEPAGDVKLRFDLPSEKLDELAPGLRALLYFKDPAKAGDLADQGSDAPNLRFPQLLMPLRFGGEMGNAVVSITRAGAKKPLVLKGEKVRVNDLQVHTREGGTIQLHLRVQCLPSEEQAGKLYAMIKQDVNVTIEEGEEVGSTAQPPAPE